MVISDAHRLLFVHVQKTGGSTVTHRLRAALPDARALDDISKHSTLKGILAADPSLHGYWSFGVVRNPWARMLSWHRMAARFAEHAAEGREKKQQMLERGFVGQILRHAPKFETFVMEGPERWPRLRTQQVHYLTAPDRRVDLVARQETLEADLRAVFARFDLPWEPLTSLNVDTERPDYREHYTPAMRDRVAALYHRDVELFGYTF